MPLKISNITSFNLHSYPSYSDTSLDNLRSRKDNAILPFFFYYGILFYKNIFKFSVKFPVPTCKALSKALSALNG